MNEPTNGGEASSQNAMPCLNCGEPGTGRFCARCGQRKSEVRVSLRRLISDVLEDQLSIDATLPRTLRALLFHPGRLTSEYMIGRMASYIAPFRLYLVASLLFFLMLSLKSGDPVWDEVAPSAAAEAGRATPERASTEGIPAPAAPTASDDSVTPDGRTGQRGSGADTTGQPAAVEPGGPRPIGVFVPPGAERDSTNWTQNLEILEINTGIARLDSLLAMRLRRLGRLPREEAASAVVSGFLQRAPTMMFLMLPVFALMLKVLHLGSGRYYVEHFVFALHYHAFAFTLYTLMLVLDWIPVLPSLLGLWVLLYLPIAMKRVYRHGWILTLFKWSLLGTGYLLLLTFGLVATVIVTALML